LGKIAENVNQLPIDQYNFTVLSSE